MYYIINHTTRFSYNRAISESITEVRMQPRTEEGQRCLSYELKTQPRVKIYSYMDYLDNVVHHFDILQAHKRLEIATRALVEVQPNQLVERLSQNAWDTIDAHVNKGLDWDFVHPSHFIQFTPLLESFAQEIGAERRSDPLSLLREIMTAIYNKIDYVPNSTKVDSPIDDGLSMRQGVCQDFSHIMVALVRRLGIPCRYVSGYLFTDNARSGGTSEDATHAWIDAWLPELGWVGFDPTNNTMVEEKHIRIAVGRDYKDVPPSQGLFKGNAQSQLEVAVQVLPTDKPPTITEPVVPSEWATAQQMELMQEIQRAQQQQQQQ